MKRVTFVALFVCLSGATFTAAADDGDRDRERNRNEQTVLEFDVMAPVTGVFVGTGNPIRGVPGGGLPWAFAGNGGAKGELRRDGTIEIRVRGLVLANSDPVPANLRLTNPIPMFKAIVSCLMAGSGAMVNVSTNNFPATTGGDSMIRDHVDLPASCVAPIIFVTSPGGAWFAATGF